MPRRLLEQEKKEREEIRAEVEKRRKKGMFIKDIAKELNLSFTGAFAYAKGFKSVSEYQKELAEKRGFVSVGEYRAYKNLEKGYKNRVLGLVEDLNSVGYVIRELKEEKGTLAIKLLEENKEYDKNKVENNFKENLQKYLVGCLQANDIRENENKFEVFYRRNTVFIKVKNPNDLESRAKLKVYGSSLERKVVRRI